MPSPDVESEIVQIVVPGGDCSEPVPLPPPANFPITLRSGALCSSVTVPPFLTTVPVPVYVVPPQQKRYWPVPLLISNTLPGLLLSCRHTSNVVTLKEQVAVLAAASVAVQLTVVVPGMNVDPEGGLHTAVTPGQLSLAVGGGKVTTTPVPLPATVTFAGQTMVGG